jgi:hypothetical protein
VALTSLVDQLFRRGDMGNRDGKEPIATGIISLRGNGRQRGEP